MAFNIVDSCKVHGKNYFGQENNASNNNNVSEDNFPSENRFNKAIGPFSKYFFTEQYISPDVIRMLKNSKNFEITDDECALASLEQCKIVAGYILNGLALKARNNKSYTEKEAGEAVKEAFNCLASKLSSIQGKLGNKISLLANSAPLLVKMSNDYVNYSESFKPVLHKDLLQYISDSKLTKGQKKELYTLKKNIENLFENLFSKEICSVKGMQGINNANELPDFSKMQFNECFQKASFYLLNLFRQVREEKRVLTEEEKESIQGLFTSLADNFSPLLEVLKEKKEFDAIKKEFFEIQEEANLFPEERKEQIQKLTEVVINTEKSLKEIQVDTKSALKHEDFKEIIEDKIHAKEEEVAQAKGNLQNYEEKSTEILNGLENKRVSAEKTLNSAEEKWNQYLKDTVGERKIDFSVTEKEIASLKNLSSDKGVEMLQVAFSGFLSLVEEKAAEEKANMWFFQRLFV